jgi:osmotically-inducible protein OsmY
MSTLNQERTFHVSAPARLPAPRFTSKQSGWNSILEGIVKRSLAESSHRDLRLAQCQIDDGVVILRGQVSSFYLKQLAQAQLMRMDNGLRVQNELEVVYPCEAPPSGRADDDTLYDDTLYIE